ncbi:hypothetical protein Dimus_032510 [Dionaea muscipula]
MKKGTCKPNGSPWGKALGTHGRFKGREYWKPHTKKVLVERRDSYKGYRRRHADGVDKKVRTLRKLISNNESDGIEDLFMNTAKYIMSLEMRVGLIKIMIDALSDCK